MPENRRTPTDTERIDALERFINEHGAIVLHDGNQETGRHSGLGLRPGILNRTLREAIDTALLSAENPEASAK